MIAYAAFAAYAVLSAIFSGGRDQVWSIWAACGYAAALLMLWRWRHRTAAVLVSVALAVLVPLLWLSAEPLEDGMNVIDRAAAQPCPLSILTMGIPLCITPSGSFSDRHFQPCKLSCA